MVKQSTRNKLIELFIGGVILVLFVFFIQDGYSNRPIIKYSLSDCQQTYFSHEQSEPRLVTLKIGNQGNSDAVMSLRVRGENITINNGIKKPFLLYKNNTEVIISINVEQKSEMSTLSPENNIWFSINKSVDSFSYNYDVLKGKPNYFFKRISYWFAEINSFYPTKCKYEKKGQDFVLVE